ncbi:hypothetical protein M667_19615 [Cellulophaga baltica NN016038]|nr:hypothetical protein M667_19615 [Cellulophaga baltica NN016038]
MFIKLDGLKVQSFKGLVLLVIYLLLKLSYPSKLMQLFACASQSLYHLQFLDNSWYYNHTLS